jgi:hypothetical protein
MGNNDPFAAQPHYRMSFKVALWSLQCDTLLGGLASLSQSSTGLESSFSPASKVIVRVLVVTAHKPSDSSALLGWNRDRATNRANHRAIPTWIWMQCPSGPCRYRYHSISVHTTLFGHFSPNAPSRSILLGSSSSRSRPGVFTSQQHETLWTGAGFPCCAKSAVLLYE